MSCTACRSNKSRFLPCCSDGRGFWEPNIWHLEGSKSKRAWDVLLCVLFNGDGLEIKVRGERERCAAALRPGFVVGRAEEIQSLM